MDRIRSHEDKAIFKVSSQTESLVSSVYILLPQRWWWQDRSSTALNTIHHLLVCLKIWHPSTVPAPQSPLSQFLWVILICSSDALLVIMKDMMGGGWGRRALYDTDANKRGRDLHKIHHHTCHPNPHQYHNSILVFIWIQVLSLVCVCVFLGGHDAIKECSKVSSPLCVAKLDLSQAWAVCKLVTESSSAQCTVRMKKITHRKLHWEWCATQFEDASENTQWRKVWQM